MGREKEKEREEQKTAWFDTLEKAPELTGQRVTMCLARQNKNSDDVYLIQCSCLQYFQQFVELQREKRYMGVLGGTVLDWGAAVDVVADEPVVLAAAALASVVAE